MHEIFKPNIVNIFCDASIIKKDDNKYIGFPGAVVVLTNNNPLGEIVETDYLVLNNSTNNNSEIMAILLGVKLALKYRHYDCINIFSDSKISVSGLKEWIFNWVNNKVDDIMYSSSGNPVANQDIFLKIVRMIVENFNGVNLNLYHQKGHIDPNSKKDMAKAYKCFDTSNGFNLTPIDIARISKYNDHIDNFTRDISKHDSYVNVMRDVLPSIMCYDPSASKMVLYKQILKRK